MREPTIEELFSRGTGFLELYLSPSRFFSKYEPVNNYRDWNYLFYRSDVAPNDQDVLIIIKTSQHCYTVAHYRVLDGKNELKKFSKLFDAAQYIIAQAKEYDELYAETLAEREREEAEQREEKARKANKVSTPKG